MITVEKLEPSYFDNNMMRVPSYTMYRMDTPGGRYYYTFEADEPRFYISVTTIIDRFTPTPPSLLKYIAQHGEAEAKELKNRRASYGTLMHITIEKLIKNGTLSFDQIEEDVFKYFEEEYTWGATQEEFYDELKKDILSFAQFMIDKKVQPIAVEPIVRCDKYGVAGAVDLFCKLQFNRKTVYAIIDFKSGKKGFYDSHAIQLAYYREAILEEWSDFKSEDIMLFNWAGTDWRKKPSYKLQNQTDKHSVEELKLYSDLWEIENSKSPVSDKEVLEFEGEISIESGSVENNYRVETLKDKAKK